MIVTATANPSVDRTYQVGQLRPGDWHAVPPDITPVDPTGAGDALLAGYLAAETAEPPTRLAYAVSVGTSACLVEATADLPDQLVDPARVRIHPLNRECIGQGGRP